MSKLTVRDLASVDVDLWGKVFETVPATRTVYAAITALEHKLDEIPDDQLDDQVAVIAEILDQRLKPAGQGRKKASEIVVEKWAADELTIAQLYDFAERLGEADRPT